MEFIIINQSDENETLGTVYQDDNRTAQLFQQFGFSHLPEKGSKGVLTYIGNGRGNGVIIAGQNPEAAPGGSQGETVIYSTSGGTIQAKIKLDSSGNVIINDGLSSAVSFAELKAGFDQLKADFNTHIHPTPSGPSTAPTIPSTASVDSSEVQEVKLP